MTTITCTRCSTENPDSAMNCSQCRINPRFALEHPEEIEAIKQRNQGTEINWRECVTESNYSSDPDVRAMRYFARILALAGAGFWTYSVAVIVLLAIGMGPDPDKSTIENHGLLILFIVWGSVVTAWAWERLGGVVLILEGLIGFIVLSSAFDFNYSVCTNLMILVAGVLFLVSWSKSRTSQSAEKDA